MEVKRIATSRSSRQEVAKYIHLEDFCKNLQIGSFFFVTLCTLLVSAPSAITIPDRVWDVLLTIVLVVVTSFSSWMFGVPANRSFANWIYLANWFGRRETVATAQAAIPSSAVVPDKNSKAIDKASSHIVESERHGRSVPKITAASAMCGTSNPKNPKIKRNSITTNNMAEQGNARSRNVIAAQSQKEKKKKPNQGDKKSVSRRIETDSVVSGSSRSSIGSKTAAAKDDTNSCSSYGNGPAAAQSQKEKKKRTPSQGNKKSIIRRMETDSVVSGSSRIPIGSETAAKDDTNICSSYGNVPPAAQSQKEKKRTPSQGNKKIVIRRMETDSISGSSRISPGSETAAAKDDTNSCSSYGNGPDDSSHESKNDHPSLQGAAKGFQPSNTTTLSPIGERRRDDSLPPMAPKPINVQADHKETSNLDRIHHAVKEEEEEAVVFPSVSPVTGDEGNPVDTHHRVHDSPLQMQPPVPGPIEDTTVRPRPRNVHLVQSENNLPEQRRSCDREVELKNPQSQLHTSIMPPNGVDVQSNSMLCNSDFHQLIAGSTLVSVEDRNLVTDALLLSLAQMVPCTGMEETGLDGGKVGLTCKHCLGNFVIDISSNFDSPFSMSTSTIGGVILRHMVFQCPACPSVVRNAIVLVEQSNNLLPGGRQVFFERLWSRLFKAQGNRGWDSSSDRTKPPPARAPHNDYEQQQQQQHEKSFQRKGIFTSSEQRAMGEMAQFGYNDGMDIRLGPTSSVTPNASFYIGERLGMHLNANPTPPNRRIDLPPSYTLTPNTVIVGGMGIPPMIRRHPLGNERLVHVVLHFLTHFDRVEHPTQKEMMVRRVVEIINERNNGIGFVGFDGPRWFQVSEKDALQKVRGLFFTMSQEWHSDKEAGFQPIVGAENVRTQPDADSTSMPTRDATSRFIIGPGHLPPYRDQVNPTTRTPQHVDRDMQRGTLLPTGSPSVMKAKKASGVVHTNIHDDNGKNTSVTKAKKASGVVHTNIHDDKGKNTSVTKAKKASSIVHTNIHDDKGKNSNRDKRNTGETQRLKQQQHGDDALPSRTQFLPPPPPLRRASLQSMGVEKPNASLTSPANTTSSPSGMTSPLKRPRVVDHHHHEGDTAERALKKPRHVVSNEAPSMDHITTQTEAAVGRDISTLPPKDVIMAHDPTRIERKDAEPQVVVTTDQERNQPTNKSLIGSTTLLSDANTTTTTSKVKNNNLHKKRNLPTTAARTTNPTNPTIKTNPSTTTINPESIIQRQNEIPKIANKKIGVTPTTTTTTTSKATSTTTTSTDRMGSNMEQEEVEKDDDPPDDDDQDMIALGQEYHESSIYHPSANENLVRSEGEEGIDYNEHFRRPKLLNELAMMEDGGDTGWDGWKRYGVGNDDEDADKELVVEEEVEVEKEMKEGPPRVDGWDGTEADEREQDDLVI